MAASVFCFKNGTYMDDKALVRATVRSIVESEASVWRKQGFFVVDIACKGSDVAAGGIDEITVTVDCDGLSDDGRLRSVGIDDCALLSREISAALKEQLPKIGTATEGEGDDAEKGEEADFALTVMSAGLGQPIKMGRQYRKLMTRAAMRDVSPRVDVLFRDGRKLAGVVLCGIGYDNGEAAEECTDAPAAIDVMYEVKELLPGKKRKTPVERHERIQLADTKTVSETFDFK